MIETTGTGMDPDGGSDGDLTRERKHTAMLNRLAAKEDARLQQSAARRAGSAAAGNPEESTDYFTDTFTESCRNLEQTLSSLQQQRNSDTASLKDALDHLAVQLSNLEQYAAEKAYFLPAFEVRSSQSTIASLREKLDAVNDELMPKKRFSFKNKTHRKSVEDDHRKDTKSIGDNLTGGSVREEKGKDNDSVFSDLIPTDSSCRIHDMKDAVIIRDLKHLEVAEIVLENLINCKVFLMGKCSALYVHKLNDCEIYTGPVTGSALLEGVEDCILMLASHQIRIHHTRKTDLYLRVRSRPIVECTSDVRVAPYAFSYNGIMDDLIASNLHEETGLWQKVDDFRWLRAVPSPNWSIIPESDRLPLVNDTGPSHHLIEM